MQRFGRVELGGKYWDVENSGSFGVLTVTDMR